MPGATCRMCIPHHRTVGIRSSTDGLSAALTVATVVAQRLATGGIRVRGISGDNGTRRGRSAMGEHREHTERFTDEEFAFLRHVRFGELPARVAPADMVETAETDPPPEEPGQPPVRREW
jgi:hypothetical protein